MTDAPAPVLAAAYHERWEHLNGNMEVKTFLRGPGNFLRSHSPYMVKQFFYVYLLAHQALSALICSSPRCGR